MRRQCSNELRFRDKEKKKVKEKLKEGRKNRDDRKSCCRMVQKRAEEKKTDKFRYRQ